MVAALAADVERGQQFEMDAIRRMGFLADRLQALGEGCFHFREDAAICEALVLKLTRKEPVPSLLDPRAEKKGSG